MNYDALVEVRDALGEEDDEALRAHLRTLRPADLADVIERLDPSERDQIFEHLDDEAAAAVIHELDETVAAAVVRGLPAERASRLLGDLPADDAADVLQDLPDKDADALLASMDAEEAEDVRELLEYPENSAGGRMITDFVAIPEGMSVAEVIAGLRAHPPAAETSYYLYVCDRRERLLGVVSLRDLIVSAPSARISEIMARDVISVRADADQEEAAELVARYDLLALPVVDDQERLVGVVTVDDVLEVLEEEATEDILHLSSGAERPTEGAGSVMRARLPRTTAALAAGLVAAGIMAAWRGALREHIVFVAFVPFALALSEVVTAQVVAAVRGVLRREAPAARLARFIFRELAITGAVAVAVAAITVLLLGRWAHLDAVASRLGLAAFLVAVVASVIGGLVPVLSRALGRDVAAVPVSLAAAISDTVALAVFLWVTLAH